LFTTTLKAAKDWHVDTAMNVQRNVVVQLSALPNVCNEAYLVMLQESC